MPQHHEGRPSKLKDYGLIGRVNELYANGMRVPEITRTINDEQPENQQVSEATVYRHLQGITKKTRNVVPIDIISEFQRGIGQLEFNMNSLKSLDKSDRRAITKYLNNWKRIFQGKLAKVYKEKPELRKRDIEVLREMSILFSNCMCMLCRMEVNKEILRLEELD